jgi:hypothetical protein
MYKSLVQDYARGDPEGKHRGPLMAGLARRGPLTNGLVNSSSSRMVAATIASNTSARSNMRMLNRIEQDVIPALDPSRWTCLCLKRGGAYQKGNPGQKYRQFPLRRNALPGTHSINGSSIATMRPPSDALVAHTLPPCDRTMRSVIARPSPAPPVAATPSTL